MSEKILQILMQLFAIIARVDELDESIPSEESLQRITSTKGKRIVQQFLTQEIGEDLTERYLQLFDEYLNSLHKTSKKRHQLKKRTSVNSVKILRICNEINRELIQIQKIIILVRLVEFISSNEDVTQQEIDFVTTVSEAFNISEEEFKEIFEFGSKEDKLEIDHENILFASSEKLNVWKKAKQIEIKGLKGTFMVLRVKSVNAYFLRYFGENQIILNGQIVPSKRQYIFNPGSSIKTLKSVPLYYSNVVTHFLSNKASEKILFECERVNYKFHKNKVAVHTISFKENSGNLIGIMGGSGTGKSTLLNILNGNLKPYMGRVLINGIDIHLQPDKIEGVIGYVSQDDLLIEELTVYENLFFNAQLCYKNLSKFEINKKVIQILKSIGLYESRNLKVGSPLAKIISGGQRKRLNIALELIREPSVLFIDEPTSGLSSRDSENIMDLLKGLSLKGNLIFTVIHQPSSSIFKMFDKLLLLDQGGYPVFYGDPIDSVVYFKTEIDHANCEERACPVCGNVNSEQIFDIIEAKVIDEFGNPTSKRKISPQEWNRRYKKNKIDFPYKDIKTRIKISNGIPSRWKQFTVFLKRDLLAKLANKQYLIVNTIQAPILAIILTLFVKYFAKNEHSLYTFSVNENIPQFLFIAVIVALFLGLTMSAEEIIKDKHILKRESFLNLSKGSYLLSKICILFIISAFQTLLFVLIGNTILGIKGLWVSYWLVLFSASCFANLLGLNISATFNTEKVIYILIPLMIIPQLLFSGVIVKFDKLHPWFAKEDNVPWIGNVMTSRWAYEGLAVEQYTHNKYAKAFFEIDQKISQASWKRDYWLPELINQQNIYNNYYKDTTKSNLVESAKSILISEITKEENLYDPELNFNCKDCISALQNKEWSFEINKNMKDFLKVIKKIYIYDVNKYQKEKSNITNSFGSEKIKSLKSNYMNEALSDHVTNRNEIDKIVITKNRIIQKADPIYKIEKRPFFRYQFYAPYKYIGNYKTPTLYANIIVIWGMSLLFAVTLYFDLFKKILTKFEKMIQRYKKD